MDYHARFYDAAMGKFIQPDTDNPDSQGPQGLNRYSYVNNNPIINTYPLGHAIPYSCLLCQIIGPNANDIWGLFLRGILHFSHTDITGQGFENIKRDPDIKKRDNSEDRN